MLLVLVWYQFCGFHQGLCSPLCSVQMWKWQPTPVSLPGEFHGQKSLSMATVQGSQIVGHNMTECPGGLTLSLWGCWPNQRD